MFGFLFGHAPPPPPPQTYEPMMLITTRNEVGELVLMEVPKPIKIERHPKLRLRAYSSQTFLRYDSERGQT